MKLDDDDFDTSFSLLCSSTFLSINIMIILSHPPPHFTCYCVHCVLMLMFMFFIHSLPPSYHHHNHHHQPKHHTTYRTRLLSYHSDFLENGKITNQKHIKKLLAAMLPLFTPFIHFIHFDIKITNKRDNIHTWLGCLKNQIKCMLHMFCLIVMHKYFSIHHSRKFLFTCFHTSLFSCSIIRIHALEELITIIIYSTYVLTTHTCGSLVGS